MTEPMKPASTPTHPTPVPTPTQKAQVSTATTTPTLEPFEVMPVPLGARAIGDVKPGYEPGDGSPSPSEPDKLFNPNNPLSPVTRPSNPSNPANPPNTQSDRPADEKRIYEANLAKTKTPTAEQTKAADELKKKKEDLHKKIADIMATYNHAESSIPASNEYWSLVNQLRALNNP